MGCPGWRLLWLALLGVHFSAIWCSPGDGEGIWSGGGAGRFCYTALFVLHHDALVQTQHHLDSDPSLGP
ncbi:hypothetical protein F2P79_022700 [Pimephales promelas]|nr:hypothetical protein F2P79_022700 [Pimephales promelas]